ncbi:PEP-CTERM sorting domain-containing protein [Limnofasciculus baicalensis]|uniref:PEP-CTERM sorting domain-containing protein n=1 Tax=Limnofasciculus baicalensis BBK-W-15 TaxID=2699891 RepID=A0AAE3GUQ9_9CYAN|nr:PEP-CTERM sorting domain-containing protein [Limnofasciculus baicalensis]MCP2730341.1 PEP-CTERM sorting domain-containing protein [Limnofasciculus baicalensis BBK-W-15]
MTNSTLIKKLIPQATATIALLAACTLATPKAEASPIVLDFEGIGNFQPIGNFYDTAPHDFDITFSGNALAIVDIDAGGGGNFGGEPSPSTIAFFLDGPAATMNVLNGFNTGFSFFYAAINQPGFITVWDDLNGTGNILASLQLPVTPFNGAPDPTGVFSPFVPIGVAFNGIAKSVNFGGTVNQVGFDNITLGSDTPIKDVPEPASTLGLLALSAMGATSALKRKKGQNTQDNNLN